MQLFPLQPYQDKKICVAVSGGVDSVCLLHYFYRHAAEFRIRLSAVTCEHGIRGKASLSDLAFVESLCRDWNVPLSVFRADVPALSAQRKLGVEEAGRTFRYECFDRILASGQADFVATAHHKDDFAETVLFRLIRGTSLSGLNAFDRKGIIRPMLGVTRAEIQSYAEENSLPYVTDESNSDEAYTRNYLRHTVLPALEQAVNGAGGHLVDFALRAKADDDFLQSLAEREIVRGDGEISISAALPQPLFSRAAVLAMKEFGVKKDYTQGNVVEISALKKLQSGKRACLPNGAECVREGERIIFYRPEPPCREELPFLPGSYPFGKYRVTVGANGTENALYADADAFPEGCVIRTRRQGDRFTPFKGTDKALKEYLTDKKIPARKSRNLPLIANGSVVYAVFGVEISDRVKATDRTETIVRLSLSRNE